MVIWILFGLSLIGGFVLWSCMALGAEYQEAQERRREAERHLG